MRLYRKDPTGLMRTYEITPNLEHEGYDIKWGVLNGVKQEKFTEVFENLSNRPMEEQIDLEVEAKIKKMLDSGYKITLADAEQSDGNQLDLPRPMLAKKYDAKRPIEYGAFIQYKYDGHRCLIHNTGSELIAYSRKGIVIDTIDHITDTLDIPEGVTLDGELYAHGVSLQKIHSLVKRKQKDTIGIKYIVYDQIQDQMYIERYRDLLSYDISGPSIEIAPTIAYYGGVSIQLRLKEAIEKGYEGLIARDGVQGYQSGKRSHSLVKVKLWLDDIFEVMNVYESKDGWAILDFGKFTASAPGSIEEKEEILDNAEHYIGQNARVEYARLTKAGVPFHPIVTNFMD